MSDKTIRRLWGVCLIVGGVCAVIIGVLNIMGLEPPKALVPVLCIVLLFPIVGTPILTAQIMKRQKKK